MDDPFAGVVWRDARELGLRGVAWGDEARERPYDRLPAALKGQVSDDLWRLSTQSAGLYVELEGAFTDVFARWELAEGQKGSEHMAPVARSGMDTYGRDGNGVWRWVGSRSTWREPHCDGRMHAGKLDGKRRVYRVYLPLMARLVSLEIGSREAIGAVEADARKPVVYYGTSIVHGAAVGRAGMSHAAQLGRMLEREVINLGFAGRAFCEGVLAEWISRVSAEAYLLDVLPNNSAEQLGERLPPFVRTLRSRRPETPIVLIGDRRFGDAAFIHGRAAQKEEKDRKLMDVVEGLQREGVKGLHLALHESWFGDDSEGTTDGSHPNDLGAWRMAQALAGPVRQVLGRGIGGHS